MFRWESLGPSPCVKWVSVVLMSGWAFPSKETLNLLEVVGPWPHQQCTVKVASMAGRNVICGFVNQRHQSQSEV